MDLTEPNQAETALRASEQPAAGFTRFEQATLDSLTANICVLAEDGTILAVNEAWRAFAAANPPRPANADVGASYLAVCEAVVGEEASAVQEVVRGLRAVAHGDVPEFALEYPCHSPDTQRWFILRATRFAGAGPVRILIAHHDITERKRAEEALRESEHHFQLLYQHLHAGVVVHAPDTRITHANEGACELLGLSVAQMIGKTAIDPAWRFVREDETAMPLEEYPVQRVLATRRPIRDLVVGVDRPHTKDRVWVLVSAFPDFDAHERLRRAVVTFVDITALRKAEQTLRLKNLVFDASIAANSIADVNGVITEANAAFYRMWAYPGRDEVVGRPLVDFINDPNDAGAIVTALNETGQWDGAYLAKRKDGSTFIAHGLATTLRDAQDRLVGYQSAVLDITDRMRAEEALRESEQRFMNVLRASRDAILLLDGETFVDCNDATAQMLGYIERDALLKTHPSELSPPTQPDGQDSFEKANDMMNLAFQNGSNRFEWTHRRANGEDFPVEVTLTSIMLNGKSVLHCVWRDLTERKQAEKQLADLHRQHQLVLDAAAEGILGLDSDGRHTFVNPAAATMLGYKIEELLGRPSHSLWHHTRADGSAYPPEQCEIYACLRHGGAMRAHSDLFWRKDGTSIPVEFACTSIAQGGAAIGVVVTFSDITERKRTEREREVMELHLRQAQKLESIGQLAAGIAHEINTPMQYIGDNTRFLQDAFGDLRRVVGGFQDLTERLRDQPAMAQALSPVEAVLHATDVDYLLEEIPKAIEESLEGAERVTKIVRAMKEFSHPGTEQKTAVDLNHAIESTVTIARNEWKYVADLETDFDPQLPPVPCLPGEFNQVILNLIINAAHAIEDVVGKDSGTKGRITIRTRREEKWAEIRVEDTGTGIPEAVRGRIFEPFFTTKSIGKGSGQGLAIAHSVIVGKHGGSLTFETERGRGTTFIILLPR